MSDLTKIEKLVAWQQVNGDLDSSVIFRLMKLPMEQFDKELAAMPVKKAGLEKALQDVADKINFLEDECRRCYKELEEYEIENERLKTQNKNLLEAFGRLVWKDMRSSALGQRNRRKYLAR